MSTELSVDTETKLKVPSLYKVILLNDDFTPMEFVIQVLVEIFGKSHAEAYKLAMDVHNQGRGLAGTYTREIANQKVLETSAVAAQYQHPLKCVAEVA